MSQWGELPNLSNLKDKLWILAYNQTYHFKHKIIYRLLAISVLLFQLLTSFGQEVTKTVKFDAKISEVETMGGKLIVVKVYITTDNILTDSIIAQNGRLKYSLVGEHIFKIEFTKSGYVSKHLVVSTKNPSKKTKTKSSLKVDVSLFKYQKELEVDFLNSKPIGVARFEEYSGKLKWDVNYTRMIVEKIIQATLDLYKKKNPEE